MGHICWIEIQDNRGSLTHHWTWVTSPTSSRLHFDIFSLITTSSSSPHSIISLSPSLWIKSFLRSRSRYMGWRSWVMVLSSRHYGWWLSVRCLIVIVGCNLASNDLVVSLWVSLRAALTLWGHRNGTVGSHVVSKGRGFWWVGHERYGATGCLMVLLWG